jgi:hypothetical protein
VHGTSFFAEITSRRIRRGTFASVVALKRPITAYVNDRDTVHLDEIRSNHHSQNQQMSCHLWRVTLAHIIRSRAPHVLA